MSFTITATCTVGGYISPEGVIPVEQGGSQRFTYAAEEAHYFLQVILVDGVSCGAYMRFCDFVDVQANHTVHIVYHLWQLELDIPFNCILEDPAPYQRGGAGPAALEWVYDYGTSVTLTVVPPLGYTFYQWTQGLSGTDNPATIVMTANITVGVIFIITPLTYYTLTPIASSHGHISPPTVVQVAQAASYTFTFIPDEGYEITLILVDDDSVGAAPSYTFANVQASHTITAVFTIVVSPPGTYRITTVGLHVTIAPSNPDVAEHTDQIFTFTPASSDYEVESVVVDDVSVGMGLSYTFYNVSATHRLTVYGKFIGTLPPTPPAPLPPVSEGLGGGRFKSVKITPYVSGDDYADLTPDGEMEAYEQYIGWANPEENTWPTEMFTHITDLSAGEVSPVMTVRELQSTAIYLPQATALGIAQSKHIPFTTERAEEDPDFVKPFDGLVLVRHITDASTNDTNWETWKITQGILTEPAPESVVPYVAAYPDTWYEEALLSGFDVAHPGLLGSYWYANEHRSYLDVVKSNLGGEDWRVTLCRCLSFDTTPVPAFATQFLQVEDWYQLSCRSYHLLDEGQFAHIIAQVSEHSDFDPGETPDERWLGSLAALYIDSVYQYHEAVGGLFLDRAKTWYVRLKRVDGHYIEVEGEEVWIEDTVTGWSPSMTITSACRWAPATYTFSDPSYVPYYVYREYLEEDSTQVWELDYKLVDEDTTNVRIQVATSESFETLLRDVLSERVWSGKYEGEIQTAEWGREPLATCYARLRAEDWTHPEDVKVSPWSNVFELDSVTPINHYTDNAYVFPITYVIDYWYWGYDVNMNWVYQPHYLDISYVEETHDISLETFSTELAFLGNSVLSYAIVRTNGVIYLYTVTSEGSTQVLLENDYIYEPCLIAFAGKVYAGYQMYVSGIDNECFVWRDVTDGVIGEAHSIPPPEDSDGFEWVTLADIYGKLRVVASIVWYGGGM